MAERGRRGLAKRGPRQGEVGGKGVDEVVPEGERVDEVVPGGEEGVVGGQ